MMQEKLIDDILDMVKISHGKLSLNIFPSDIGADIKEIYMLFSYKVNKNVKFTYDVDKSVPHFISIDEKRYNQVIYNLLSNSSKFTTKGFIKLSLWYDH